MLTSDLRSKINALWTGGKKSDFVPDQADTFLRCITSVFRADHILANPPLNDSYCFQKDFDALWQFGVLLKGNVNFASVERCGYHFVPEEMAGFTLANYSISFNQSGGGDVRLRQCLRTQSQSPNN